MGAEIPTDGLTIAAGVAKAPGYETTPATGYIVANSTNIFSDNQEDFAIGGATKGAPVKRGRKRKA
jgi:hypothetical protein